MEKMSRRLERELQSTEGKVVINDIDIDGVQYRPKYEIGVQECADVPPCLCCGADGMQFQQCVKEIIDYGTDDAIVMKEIEKKLTQLVKNIEDRMSVCSACFDSDDFHSMRPDVYKKVSMEERKKLGLKDNTSRLNAAIDQMQREKRQDVK